MATTFWLNIHFPNYYAKVHQDITGKQCPYVLRDETRTKGIGRMKEGGGWLPFARANAPWAYMQKTHPHFEVDTCGYCKPPKA